MWAVGVLHVCSSVTHECCMPENTQPIIISLALPAYGMEGTCVIATLLHCVADGELTCHVCVY